MARCIITGPRVSGSIPTGGLQLRLGPSSRGLDTSNQNGAYLCSCPSSSNDCSPRQCDHLLKSKLVSLKTFVVVLKGSSAPRISGPINS